MTSNKEIEIATLAGGCFWCLEAIFSEVQGVKKVTVGYAGGETMNPTYKEVCGGKTGHAEVVQVIFNPFRISYRELLEIFFAIHDPTTLNRQGADIGTQYRSAIFYHNRQQKDTAEELVKELDRGKLWPESIVTKIAPLDRFYPAEEDHQRYFSKHPEQTYCQIVITPKLVKFRKHWTRRLKR